MLFKAIHTESFNIHSVNVKCMDESILLFHHSPVKFVQHSPPPSLPKGQLAIFGRRGNSRIVFLFIYKTLIYCRWLTPYISSLLTLNSHNLGHHSQSRLPLQLPLIRTELRLLTWLQIFLRETRLLRCCKFSNLLKVTEAK